MGVQVMFSKPLPALSCRLNAWVTMLTCQWLMGPCKVTLSCHMTVSFTSMTMCFTSGGKILHAWCSLPQSSCVPHSNDHVTQQLTMHWNAEGWSLDGRQLLQVNDVDLGNGTVATGQGVLVER